MTLLDTTDGRDIKLIVDKTINGLEYSLYDDTTVLISGIAKNKRELKRILKDLTPKGFGSTLDLVWCY